MKRGDTLIDEWALGLLGRDIFEVKLVKLAADTESMAREEALGTI